MVANGCTDLGGSTQHAISPNAMQSYHKTFKITQTEYVCVCLHVRADLCARRLQ